MFLPPPAPPSHQPCHSNPSADGFAVILIPQPTEKDLRNSLQGKLREAHLLFPVPNSLFPVPWPLFPVPNLRVADDPGVGRRRSAVWVVRVCAHF